MQPLKTKAIILRRTNFGEADRILQIITPTQGKLGVIAKGVRREKSKLASSVELFSESEIVVAKGKSELGTLTSGRLVTFYAHIMSDYDRLQFAYEVLKKINQVAEHVSEAGLYDTTRAVLAALDDQEIDIRITKIWFYLQIAEILGRGLNLSRDDRNQALAADALYRFDIAEMSFHKEARGRFGSEHLKLLKLLKVKSPEVVARISGIETYLDDCLSLAHAVGGE